MLHRVLLFDKARKDRASDICHVDGGALSAVCLRMLAYLSRDAVYKAGGAAVASLASQTAAMVNFLLTHADSGMLPLPSSETPFVRVSCILCCPPDCS